MRKWLRSRLILAMPLSILTACGSDREVTSPIDTGLVVSGVADNCPQGISDDIAVIFPTSGNARQVATTNCGQIFTDFGKGKEGLAVQRAFKFLQNTLAQNEAGHLLDPEPSVEAKIIEVFDAVFAGVGIDFPDVDPAALEAGQYAVGELTQNGPPLPTISKKAIADDGSGGLLGPISVFIVQQFSGESSQSLSVSSVSHPCPEGIDDSFDCYPPFFDYTVFPESNVNPAVGITIGQCNVSPPGVEVLLLTPEGFLPEAAAPPGLDCDENVATTGWRRFAEAALGPITPLFRVTPSFAGQNPVGGRMSSFSPVTAGAIHPHIVVFNDVNVFDDTAMENANNVLLVQNLVNFTTAETRGGGTEVWFDCRAPFFAGAGCTEGSTLHSTIEGEGFSTVQITDGSLETIPAEVKVLVLWMPTAGYSSAEINAFKQFADDGGRLVFVGEHVQFYGTQNIAAQNALLAALGTELRAKAAWFPNIALTASGGYASEDLSDLFKWSSRAWGIGVLASLPVFDGGRRKAGVEAAGADLDGALAEYREQVLVAFKDVEDQLAAHAGPGPAQIAIETQRRQRLKADRAIAQDRGRHRLLHEKRGLTAIDCTAVNVVRK